jgi:uncharacterized protein YraI
MRRLTYWSSGILATFLLGSVASAYPGVATGWVNLRQDPSVGSPRIATIPAGAYVEVYNCDRWCHLNYNGYVGFASASYIDSAGYRPGPPPPRYVPPAPFPRPIYPRPRYPWWYDRDDRRGPGFSFGFGFGT